MRVLKLPARHALDWQARFDGEWRSHIVAKSARTVTMELDDDALRDLIGDSLYYVSEMGPDNTGEEDYRPAARRCLAAIGRQVEFTHRGFVATLA